MLARMELIDLVSRCRSYRRFDERVPVGEADVDVGIVAQTMLLGAAERGLGGCMFGAVKPDELARRLFLPGHLAVSLVIALGSPVEKVVLESLPADGSIRCYRDAQVVHHVRKRSAEELVHAVFKP